MAFGFSPLVSTAITNVIIIIISCLYLKNNFKGFINNRNFGFINYRLIIMFIIVFVILWFFTQVGSTYISWNVNDIAYDNYTQNINSNELLSLILVIALAPIAEEILFRGVISYNLTFSGRYLVLGLLMQALIFSLIHGTITHLLSTFVLGVFLGVIYYVSNNLIFPIITHIVYNVIAYQGFNINIPDILFSPFIWVPILIIILAYLLGLAIHCKKLINKQFLIFYTSLLNESDDKEIEGYSDVIDKGLNKTYYVKNTDLLLTCESEDKNDDINNVRFIYRSFIIDVYKHPDLYQIEMCENKALQSRDDINISKEFYIKSPALDLGYDNFNNNVLRNYMIKTINANGLIEK